MKFLPKLFLAIIIFLCILVHPTTSYAALDAASSAVVAPGPWQEDSDVTFAGKTAARARQLLENIIADYYWSNLKPPPNLSPAPVDNNPFNAIWITIRNIVYALLSLFILAGAFLLIITRGQSITVKRFVPRFILVVILVTLSFSIIQFLYQITDVLQGFFLKKGGGPDFIQSKDLLNISFAYDEFIGYKRAGAKFDESAFISLLMVKLTAATYYAMFIILIIRKVILWFFIIVSPIFPLLLFFSPIRNTAKIWIGEFFRWLLYGPLFAIFLAGLVALWQIYIPITTKGLPCDKLDKNIIVYPTSINILLGGPCQKLSPDTTPTDVKEFNNLNNPDSFMQYLVALLMLWLVIILPFILLKIFLDYLNNMAIADNSWFKYLINNNRPKPKVPSPLPLPKPPPHFTPPPILVPPMPPLPKAPMGPLSAGIARPLGRSESLSKSMANLKSEVVSNQMTQKAVSQILEMTKIQIPTIRDIARYETSMISKSATGTEEVHRLTEALNRVAGTSTLMTPAEREQSINLQGKLTAEAQKGNPVAASIKEATKDSKTAKIPEQNKLQTVSIEDYEEVRKTWEQNYKNLEPPNDFDGLPRTRVDWLKDEVKQIPMAIDLLMSGNPEMQERGKQMVSKILPFLLLGGFSKQEIISYLKAKLEAAKTVLAELMKSETEEETQVYVERKFEEKPKSMTAEAKLPEETKEGVPVEDTPDQPTIQNTSSVDEENKQN